MTQQINEPSLRIPSACDDILRDRNLPRPFFSHWAAGLCMAGGHADPVPDASLRGDVLAVARPPLAGGPGHSTVNVLDPVPVMSGMKGELVAETPMSALAVLLLDFARME